jgi:hypothetical protein
MTRRDARAIADRLECLGLADLSAEIGGLVDEMRPNMDQLSNSKRNKDYP